MKVLVKCFSQVKYAVGTSELALDMDPGSTTAGLETMIREKAAGALDGVTLRTAVNKHYVSEPVPLEDGDEVAFIPPVQGG
ncbi:MAG: MoaD/ThiS family protein [Candidatus Marinimicrobia bacterium]|nr:MoaD/ThiS family protein [Candidatus Neomarinimicrobiota bacterium]